MLSALMLLHVAMEMIGILIYTVLVEGNMVWDSVSS